MAIDSQQAFDDIFRHIDAGRHDKAEALCRETLEAAPGDVSLIALLGAILLKAQQFDEGEQLLLQAIEIEPSFARPHEDLGVLYLGRNEAEKSVTYFEKAISLDDRQASAYRGLAVALHKAGRSSEADALRKKFMPTSPVAEAEALHRSGESAQAEQLCQELLKREPENISALRLLAVIATDDERYIVAEGLLRRVVTIASENPLAARDLGRFLGDRGRYPEAIESLEKAAALDDKSAEIQLILGDMRAIVGRTADALQAYDYSLALQPDEPAALLGRAHMLRISGESLESESCYRRCIEIRPEMGDAWWNLASMHGYSASDEEIATMQAQIESKDTHEDSEVALSFALARAFEQRKDFESAWACYLRGNACKRMLIKYDPVETEVQKKAIESVFTSELLAGKNASTPADKTPLFIVGMPRSGSTLLEQILASHSQVAGNGELPYIIMMSNSVAGKKLDGLHYPEIMRELGASQLTGLGRSYLHHASIHTEADKAFFTDKMPANFSHVGFIKQILPHAKIIDARRDPVATCVANFRQLFAQGKNQSYDMIELAEYYLQYVDLMAHWERVLPGAVLRVQYEDVVADIEGEVRRILDFCGLSFEQACVDFYKNARPVNTASAEQVRQPIYQSAVEFWKHYDQYLDELKEVLQVR